MNLTQSDAIEKEIESFLEQARAFYKGVSERDESLKRALLNPLMLEATFYLIQTDMRRGLSNLIGLYEFAREFDEYFALVSLFEALEMQCFFKSNSKAIELLRRAQKNFIGDQSVLKLIFEKRFEDDPDMLCLWSSM
jgi:hypothetical protein